MTDNIPASSDLVDERLFDVAAGADGGPVLRLRHSACASCGLLAFPAQDHCARCDAPTPSTTLDENGVIAATTTVLYTTAESEVPAPYDVALVTFPSGLAIYGVADSSSGRIERGETVEVAALPLPSGRLTFQFRRELKA